MNIPTIIVFSVVAVVFVAIVAREIIRKKRGESSCSCGCGGCAFRDSCKTKKK
ncbi:MAG: FeoB-associated Cys-rich membrane protein [Clostridia bacterium]|nr:FeoB-associated Cys-rich membrane protein [Clostridia bacterium]